MKCKKQKFKIGERVELAVDKYTIGFAKKGTNLDVVAKSYYKGKYQYGVIKYDIRWLYASDLRKLRNGMVKSNIKIINKKTSWGIK